MAYFGEAEVMWAWKGVWFATERKSLKGPVKVIMTQMWVDLIKAGGDREKLDGKSNKILL